jgi:[ribosomal protein S5]-alanine N-acetyltransferase
MPLPTIDTARLVLRPYTLADAARVQQMCNDWEVARTTLALPHPYPDGAAEQWIATHAEQFEKGVDLTLAVTLQTGGLVVGSVGLSIRDAHSRAELGYLIAREHWNHGYCTEAARALIDYGFNTLGLNRIQAMHFTNNPASGRVMQKAGMTKEGILRKYVRNRGEFVDVVMYSTLRPAAPA